MRYSVIIPVYNRPDEVDELLQSLTRQSFKDFEVIVVEDGSSIPCKPVTEKYQELLDVHYYDKPNSGPGQTRNYGAERSKGEYLIILDSDCILPEGYFLAVEEELQHEAADAFRRPRPRARIIHRHTESHQLLHDLLLHHRRYPWGRRRWTSSIRAASTWVCGGKCTKPWADSRGCASGRTSTSASESSRGGYTCRLFPGAWVYHKRRTDFRKFFKQVHNSGIARINLYKKYPESLKLVHLLPAAFTLGVAIFLLGTPFCPYSLLPIALYALLVCMDSTIRNRSLSIGLYSVAASFIQLIGYGTGFLRAWWNRCILGKDEFEAFKRTFTNKED